jgi:hypothetical protein
VVSLNSPNGAFWGRDRESPNAWYAAYPCERT